MQLDWMLRLNLAKFVAMIIASHKSKQYWGIALKVLILVIAIWFIYQKFMETDAQTWAQFKAAFSKKESYLFSSIPIFIGLTILNWFFEIKKWQLLVSKIKSLHFKLALKQCLASLTTSLATPARVGEYGAKAAYYTSSYRKQILLLNLFGNGMQMAITTLFGLLGCMIIAVNYEFSFSSTKLLSITIFILITIPVLYYFRNQKLLVKGVSLQSVFTYFKNLTLKIKVGTIILSLFRYLTFSILFYFLLQFFGANTTVLPTSIFIFAMYFFVSILPSFFVFDVVIRSGVAVWLFSILGVSEITVLCTVLAMWVLNFVVPAILGSYYVLTFTPNEH